MARGGAKASAAKKEDEAAVAKRADTCNFMLMNLLTVLVMINR